MNTLLKVAALVAGIVCGVVIVTPVSANVIFNFTGDCEDCASANESSSFPVTGRLTLTDGYTLGTSIDGSNFVSFVYDGSNLIDPLSLTLSGDDGNSTTTDFQVEFGGLIGSISTIPGFNDLTIIATNDLIFDTNAANGNWFVGFDDFGTNGQFSAAVAPPPPPPPPTGVPEPGSFALMFAALGSAAIVRRRKKNS
jgi:PEP-CTERM motif